MIKGSKEYMEKLTNEENEWDHKISTPPAKEGPADCIRMAEVRAVLKKIKRHKAPGLSGLVAEMIQATGDIGTQWILDLCTLSFHSLSLLISSSSVSAITAKSSAYSNSHGKATLNSPDMAPDNHE